MLFLLMPQFQCPKLNYIMGCDNLIGAERVSSIFARVPPCVVLGLCTRYPEEHALDLCEALLSKQSQAASEALVILCQPFGRFLAVVYQMYTCTACFTSMFVLHVCMHMGKRQVEIDQLALDCSTPGVCSMVVAYSPGDYGSKTRS